MQRNAANHKAILSKESLRDRTETYGLTLLGDQRKGLGICGVAQMGPPTELDRVLTVALVGIWGWGCQVVLVEEGRTSFDPTHLVLGVSQQVVDGTTDAHNSDRVRIDLTKHSPVVSNITGEGTANQSLSQLSTCPSRSWGVRIGP